MWPTQFFFKLIYWLSRNTKMVAIVSGFIFWLVGFIDAAVTSVITTISTLITALSFDGLGNVALTTVQWIGYFNAVIPLTEGIALLTVYYSILISVAIIRWTKSFVPTVSN